MSLEGKEEGGWGGVGRGESSSVTKDERERRRRFCFYELQIHKQVTLRHLASQGAIPDGCFKNCLLDIQPPSPPFTENSVEVESVPCIYLIHHHSTALLNPQIRLVGKC